ncbi:MAG: LptF/LptG family permease [Candidatus Hydrogenedentes bacterium]|nr:LptF/LptG family permease [Candidatus Hydrogenedentota bacterium]
MTIMDRYLTRRMLATLVRTLLALVLLVLLIDFLTARQREISKHEVPWAVVFEYYACFIPTVIIKYQAAAVSILITGLIVLGRAAQDKEVTALLASGVSLRRIARWPILIALLMSGVVYAFQETAGVTAFREFDRLDREYFSRWAGGERPGVSWPNLSGHWTAHILKFNRRALTGENVYMHSLQPDKVQEIRADRIYWDPDRGKWLIEDGRWSVFNPQATWEVETRRITQAEAPILETPEDLFALETPPDAKRAAELWADLQRGETLGMPVTPYWVDYYVKFAQPALCFVMIWLAIPFALRLRRGGLAISFGVSIAIGLAYVFVFFITMGLGRIDQIPPFVAAWTANAIFLVLGMVLFWRTPT